MTTYVFANNVNTTLASVASSSATTLTLSSSTNLPTLSAGQIMPLTLNDAATGSVYEVVYVTAISGATLTVTRAQEGTGAQNWSVGDFAFSTPTAETAAVTTGDPTKTFQVANATTSTQAVNLGQAQADFAARNGSTTQVFNVANAATSTQAVNLGQLLSNVVGGGLGWYADVTSSRAIGTVYTNTSGHPLDVHVTVYTEAVAGSGCRLLVDGNEISQFYTQVAVSTYGNLSAIVPVWATYEVVNAVGTNTLNLWKEL